MAEETWRDSLPDDLKELETIQEIPDVATLAKSYDDAQRYIGRSIRIPSEDANTDTWTDFKQKLEQVQGVALFPNEDDKEGWDSFYRKLGRPDDGYGTDNEQFEKMAFELGLTKHQATSLNEAISGSEKEQAEQYKLQQEKQINDLKEEWGNAFDKNSRMAVQAVDYLDKEIKADGALRESLNGQGLGDNPLFIKALSKLGGLLGENKIGNTQTSNVFNITPAEAMERAHEIIGNFESPYHDQNHPQHMTMVEKVQKLMEVAHPES